MPACAPNRYGFIVENKGLILEAVGVEAMSRPGHNSDDPATIASFAPNSAVQGKATPEEVVDVFSAGKFQPTGVYNRDDLSIHDKVSVVDWSSQLRLYRLDAFVSEICRFKVLPSFVNIIVPRWLNQNGKRL